MIRLVVADDHTLVRQGLVSLLAAAGDCRVLAEASDGAEAVELVLRLHPDVALLDLSMPRLSGLEAIRRLAKEAPRVRLLALTMHQEEEYVLAAVRAGAAGYVQKDAAAAELLQAVRTLARGQSHFGGTAAAILAEGLRAPLDPGPESLTGREIEVLQLVAEGRTTKEIAALLGISPKTAENHRGHLMQKLRAKNVAEMIREAQARGMLLR